MLLPLHFEHQTARAEGPDGDHLWKIWGRGRTHTGNTHTFPTDERLHQGTRDQRQTYQKEIQQFGPRVSSKELKAIDPLDNLSRSSGAEGKPAQSTALRLEDEEVIDNFRNLRELLGLRRRFSHVNARWFGNTCRTSQERRGAICEPAGSKTRISGSEQIVGKRNTFPRR